MLNVLKLLSITPKNLKFLLLSKNLCAKAIVIGDLLIKFLLLMGGITTSAPNPYTNERKMEAKQF
jgi:hypothetical protein